MDRVRCCSTRVHVLRETRSFAPLAGTCTCTRYLYNNTRKDRSIVLKALGHDISKRFVTKFKRIVRGPSFQ